MDTRIQKLLFLQHLSCQIAKNVLDMQFGYIWIPKCAKNSKSLQITREMHTTVLSTRIQTYPNVSKRIQTYPKKKRARIHK